MNMKEIAEFQEAFWYDNGVHVKGVIGFDHQGMLIINPWKSECGRFDVDPAKYYGEDFLQSVFNNQNLNDIIQLKHFRTEEIKNNWTVIIENEEVGYMHEIDGMIGGNIGDFTETSLFNYVSKMAADELMTMIIEDMIDG